MSPPPPRPAPIRDLGAALLPAPPGMRVAYGPESGPYGTLHATRKGAAAVRQGASCAPGLDLDRPEMRTAPAAVVAYSSDEGSVTQALVDLPSAFPAELPPACASYRAVVEGSTVSYVTRRIDLPPLGDQSRAYVTAVTGGGQSLEVGSVVIRAGTVVMSLLVVARKVKYDGLTDQSREAYERLTLAMNG
ncbi:hypothetical protein ACFXJ8_12395 [Nonomuraea sp. NPDC059194]|uniref:hypothetical protein n=1 Tax=Nonomuraea sp. NPDC059194 TaxID=3346764 RepID=UPI003681C7D9